MTDITESEAREILDDDPRAPCPECPSGEVVLQKSSASIDPLGFNRWKNYYECEACGFELRTVCGQDSRQATLEEVTDA
jgi:hypothetical protein